MILIYREYFFVKMFDILQFHHLRSINIYTYQKDKHFWCVSLHLDKAESGAGVQFLYKQTVEDK